VASPGRLAGTLGLYVVLGFTGGLLLAIALPLAFGARPLVVLSGSMEPTLPTGDVVVVKRVAPPEVEVGDVVTYRNLDGDLVTHRVRGVRPRGKRFELVTKGDANNAAERWTIDRDGQLSLALYRVPIAGRLLARTSSRQGKLALIVAPLLLLGAWEIRRIWSPRESTA
jgi:signal peptidase